MRSPGRRLQRARPERSEEGAVMLVVMLIMLTTTALAVVSLQSTQYELRASGYNRTAIQMEYVSEAGAAASLAWVDATSMDRSFKLHLKAWNDAPNPPNMNPVGEPQLLPATRQNSNRTQWWQQQRLTGIGMAPITRPGLVDVVGTFGPRSPYVAGVFDVADANRDDYVVDLYDCRQLPNTAAAGSQVNQGGSGTLRPIQYYCVVTSRGRAYVPGAPSKTWALQGQPYTVNRFSMAHDSRGAIVTPPIIP